MAQLHQDRARAESFGGGAEIYDRLRPSYPPGLIRWLTDEGSGTALDVGCGTGRVARLLLDAGWDVVGIEPDERMAALARRLGILVEPGRFEDWNPGRSPGFDLVCSGQAWHWVDPKLGYRKAAEALRPGGRLAVFWNVYRYAPEVQAAIAQVYGNHASKLLDDSVVLGTADRRHREHDLVILEASGLFDQAEARSYQHLREQSIPDWLEELRTHSIHHQIDAVTAQRLHAALEEALHAVTDGTVTVRYETAVTSGRRPRSP